MDNPDLNEVATFVRVIQAGGFTAAARLLKVPKSTVSRRVARLEERLGVTLLRRTTRSMTLTPAGREYYDRIAAPVDAIEDAAVEAATGAEVPRGTVRLTAPTDLASSLLGPAVIEFTRRYPDVVVEIDLSGRVVDMVAEGFDLALRAGRLADSTLIARTVARGSAWIFASPAYLKTCEAPDRPEQLQDHPCVLFRGRSGRATWNLVAGAERRTIEVRGAISCSDFSFVLDAVLAGAGVGLLPPFSAAAEARRGRLVRLLPDWTGQATALHLVHPPSRHLSARVRALRDFLVEWFAANSLGEMPTAGPP